MISLVFLFAIIMVVVIAPIAAFTAVRAVGRALEVMRNSPRANDDALEARLGRIEEAIDAMALQIDRLASERQAQLDPDLSKQRRLAAGSGESDS